MYVANGSMLRAADEGKSKYHLEDGHFELVNKENEDLLNAIKTGNNADIKTYYLNGAKKKAKEEYDKEFKTKFNQEYRKEFLSSFHKNYQLIKQRLDENNAYLKANEMIKQAKDNGEYQKLYQKTYQEKYHIKRGDILVLKEKYENKEYEFHVIGIYDKCQTLAVFLPIDHYHSLFDLDKDQFNMILSNELIHDIDDKYIASIIGEEDILIFCNQLDYSMGSYMTYFQVLCILLSIVLIYLLTKIIIEKNEKSISMIKILDYSDFDIGQLYLFSTTFIVFLSCLICLVLGVKMMEYCWHQILLSYNGWYAFYMIPLGYLKMFLFVFIGYLFVMFLDFHRIQKISMDKALKDNE